MFLNFDNLNIIKNNKILNKYNYNFQQILTLFKREFQIKITEFIPFYKQTRTTLEIIS